MKLEQRGISEAAGTILLHNVADADGRRSLKKGTRLTDEHLAQLAGMGRATLKIVPFAVARRDLERAVELASARPVVVEVRPFQPDRRVAMLFVAEPAAQVRTRDEYQPPTETRLAKLGAKVVAVESVDLDSVSFA